MWQREFRDQTRSLEIRIFSTQPSYFQTMKSEVVVGEPSWIEPLWAVFHRRSGAAPTESPHANLGAQLVQEQQKYNTEQCRPVAVSALLYVFLFFFLTPSLYSVFRGNGDSSLFL